MALPEDDVEELDPEPSYARILDHEHDAIVIGPGLRPGLATAELVAPTDRRRRAGSGADPARRRGAPLARDDGRLVGRRPPAGRPHAARRRVRPAARGQRPRSRRATATSPRTTTRASRRCAMPPRPGASASSSRAPGPSSRPRTARSPSRRSRTRRSPVAGPATCWPGRSARCWPRASRRSMRPGWASTCTAWPAMRPGSGSAMPASSPRTCPTASRSPASGCGRRRAQGGPASASGSRPATPLERDEPA